VVGQYEVKVDIKTNIPGTIKIALSLGLANQKGTDIFIGHTKFLTIKNGRTTASIGKPGLPNGVYEVEATFYPTWGAQDWAAKKAMITEEISTLKNMGLPTLAWVKIQSSTVKIDSRLEILDVTEPAGHVLDLLNLTVESLAHCVGHGMLVVRQDVVNMSAHRLGRLAHGGQPAVRGPEIPALPELPA